MARGDLTINVDADTGAARRELRSFSRSTGAWAGVTAAAATGVWNAAIAGAGQAVDFMGNAIQSAGELAGELETTTTRYGDATGALQTWAEQAATSLGLSEQAALGAVNQLAIFGEGVTENEQELAAWSTALVEGAVDLAALNNVTPEEAINRLTSGFKGQTEVLDELGIVANEAALKQEYLALTGEQVTGALDPAQKTMAIYSLAMREAEEASGQFARESDGLIGQQAIMDAQWANLTATLGEKFLPIALEVLGWVVDDMIPALQEWWAEIEPVVDQIVAFLIPALRDLITWIQTSVIPAIADLVSWLQTNLGPWLERIWGIIRDQGLPALRDLWDAFNNVLDAMKPLEPVLRVLVTVVGVLLYGAVMSLINQWRILAAVFNFSAGIIRGITAVIRELWSWIQNVIGAVSSLIDWIGRIRIPDLGGLGNFLGGIFAVPEGGAALGAGGGDRSVRVVYNLNVSAPIGASAGDVGASIIRHIQSYEQRNGASWRES